MKTHLYLLTTIFLFTLLVKNTIAQEPKFQDGLVIKWAFVVDNGEGVGLPHGPLGNLHIRFYPSNIGCFGQQKNYPGGFEKDLILFGPTLYSGRWRPAWMACVFPPALIQGILITSNFEWDDGDFQSYEFMGGYYLWDWYFQSIELFMYESDGSKFWGIPIPGRAHDPQFCQVISYGDFTGNEVKIYAGQIRAREDAVQRAWQINANNMNSLLDTLEIHWPEHFNEIQNGGEFYKVYLGLQNTSIPWISQDLDLKEGWNLVSFQPNLTGRSVTDELQNLINDGSIQNIIDSDGNVCIALPSGKLDNQITFISSTSGYAMNLSEAVTISVEGMQIELPLEIKLKQGWNLIGYPLLYPSNAQIILQPLINNGLLIEAIDEDNKKIHQLPNGTWINSIGNFVPGKAYYIHVLEETSFYYQ